MKYIYIYIEIPISSHNINSGVYIFKIYDGLNEKFGKIVVE